MLDSFRVLAHSWLAKILLLLLILSFAVWGIGDMLRGDGRNPTVATVGGETISAMQFQRSLHSETENIKHMMGDRSSPEMLKALNIPQRVLQRLVNTSLIKQESAALGIVPSDDDVVRQLRSEDMFRDEAGNFDKTRFEGFLHRANMSEKNYVEDTRQRMASKLLMDTLTAVPLVPDMAARTLAEARNEQRVAAFYVLGGSLVGAGPLADAAQAEAYYKEHAQEFTAPEYRSVSYVVLTPEDAQSAAAAPLDELQGAYRERIEEFKHPERRVVEQLLYDSESKAQAAEALLKNGKNFEQVAAQTDPMNQKSLQLGTVTHGELPDAAADAVFALHIGEFSEPVKSPFGWTVYRVTAVHEPSVDSFEQARPQLERDSRQRMAEEKLNTLSNTLQDALAGGSTLEEAAHDLKLSVHAVGPVDREGKAPDGSMARDVPALDKFLDTAFKTEEKSESGLVPAKNGSFYLMRVESVLPEHVKPFDAVKQQAAADWQKEARGKRLGELAKDIAVKFGGNGRNAVIGQYGLTATTETVGRTSQKAGGIVLPLELVMDIFSRKPGESTKAYGLPSGDFVLAVTQAVIPAASPDKDAKEKALVANIHSAMEIDAQNELLAQYARYLTVKYPVSIRQDVFDALVRQDSKAE
jgi:peptidyl-prolyl cis-trans isomerase D